MRLEMLLLERYGIFSDRILSFRPDARLHIVLGPNEAGKTSALAAIGDLLFGFGHLVEYDFLHDARQLRVGAEVRLADGSQLCFRRRRGNKNTLLDFKDAPLDDGLLAPILGAVTRESFRNEFGLTAETLRAGGKGLVQAGGHLTETLAASSAGLSALVRARAKLESEADALFGPRRAAGKAFYAVLDRYDEADKSLRAAIVTADALKSAEEKVRAAERGCEKMIAEHTDVGRDLARCRRAQRTRPKLAQLANMRSELAAYADLPEVSVDRLAAWRSVLAQASEIDRAIAEFDAGDAEDQTALAEQAVDEALLAAAGRVESLRERLGAVRKALVDLPKRQEAQRGAREMLAESARRLGLGSPEDLLERQPTDPALARVQDLMRTLRRAEDRRAEAEARLMQSQRARSALMAEKPAEDAMDDPSPLRGRLELFADLPAEADRLRRERAANLAEAEAIAEDAAALDPFAGTPDELARKPFPETVEIQAASAAVEALTEEARELAATKDAVAKALAAAEKEIASLSRAGAVVTREDLAQMRAGRDRTFAELGLHLDADAGTRRQHFDALGAANAHLDKVTDHLLSDAARAARVEAARERISEAHKEAKRLMAAQTALDLRREALSRAWADLWMGAQIAPKSPGLMLRWRERASEILIRRRRLAEKEMATRALAEKLSDLEAPLQILSVDLGVAGDQDLPIEMRHRMACAALEDLQSRWTQMREHVIACRNAEKSVRDAELAQAEALAEHAAKLNLWPEAVDAIGLGATASIPEAEAALSVWSNVALRRETFNRESRSVDGIERDIAVFEADAQALVAAAAPDLAMHSAHDALNEITRRLAEARRMFDARESLCKSMAERAAKRASKAFEQKALGAEISDARNWLGLADETALDAALSRLERRQDLSEGIARLFQDLMEISDGQDESTLRAEQSQQDPDALAGEIERLELRYQQLVTEIAEANTLLHEAKKARDMLAEGRDAESLASAKTECAAELIAVSERWLVRAAAARLAVRAVERQRAAVQDPLVERASRLFAIATAGAFGGLVVDYDDADRPVIKGRRANGGNVGVDHMSEGTSDQLFLALRLALLELRAAEPLPFIGDDLLASFDEKRVASTIELLADFGRIRQTILFTHHVHVAEIARQQLQNDVDLIVL
ncbi:MAG: AAA family ATPase [Methylovirgula sp.]